jgi:catechol 2,3-dioxygenase-like lactoylglutathione lyase family enzyme
LRRIVGLHHAQITIAPGQEEEARRFYCGILGLAELQKPVSLKDRGGFWVQVGDRQVHVGTEIGVERLSTKAHLAYEVADLNAMRSALVAEGTPIIDAVTIPGYDRFEIRDPFGNRVEFTQPL